MKRLKMTPAAALVFALAGVVFSPRVARAGDADQQNLAAGEALHVEGSRLLAEQKLEEASKKFGDAFERGHNPSSLLAQAVTERKLAHWAKALKLFRTYLALPANVKVTPEWRKKAEAEATECEKNACRIDVRADGFSVDGASEVGIVFAEPGAHAVSMKGKGPEKRVTVQCAAGGLVTVAYDERSPTPPTPPPGERGETGSWVLPGVLGGVGLVGVGIGVGLGAASSSATSTGTDLARGGACADLASSACAEAKDKESAASGMKTGSIIGYAVGGAFLVGGIVSALVIAPWKDRERKTAIWVAPSLGGMAFGGTF